MNNDAARPPGTHDRVELLLPWYLTGQLSVEEAGVVKAHLDGCETCRAQLVTERRLRDAVVNLDPGADATGWAAMWRRIDPPAPRRPGMHGPRAALAVLGTRRGRLIGFVVAQAAVLTIVFMAARPPAPEPTSYTLLGTPADATPGNAMIVFRPEVTEREFRATLRAQNATIVGGPTVADAYILSVPDADRDARLQRLKIAPSVVLAEAIDSVAAP